jgi:ferredoxin--NADP+ reductase
MLAEGERDPVFGAPGGQRRNLATDYNATVVGRVEAAPGLMSLRVEPDRMPFEFEPGQYVVLGLKASESRVEEAEVDESGIGAGDESAGTPESRAAVVAQSATAKQAAADPNRLILRAYNIVSDLRATRSLEFYVTLILSGELTPRLFNLKVGDRLYVGPKAQGVFTLDKWSTKSVLMIATGTGLAPYMSMIRNELMLRVDGRLGLRATLQRNGSRQFVVVHGARHSWDLGYRTELTGLARQIANFHYLPLILRPAEDPTWRGPSGYLQDFVASGIVEKEARVALTPDNFDILMCGNPDMVDSMIAWAEARGFTQAGGDQIGTLHAERYW